MDEAGGVDEVADVQRTKRVSYGEHASSFYGAYMATAMEGGHGVEDIPQSLLPYAGGREGALMESKGKNKASLLAVTFFVRGTPSPPLSS